MLNRIFYKTFSSVVLSRLVGSSAVSSALKTYKPHYAFSMLKVSNNEGPPSQEKKVFTEENSHDVRDEEERT